VDVWSPRLFRRRTAQRGENEELGSVNDSCGDLYYRGTCRGCFRYVVGGKAVASDTLSEERDVSETIVSLDQIEQIARNTQRRFWQLVPPTDDPLYIHPDSNIHAVDWKSEKWPDSVLKQMYAEMVSVNDSMYPIYRMTVVEERTGELVYYNSYGQEVWRTPAPPNYNPYLFAFELYSIESEKELTDQQKTFGRSSNVGSEILLLPVDFMDSYEGDIQEEQAEEALAVPMAMALATPPPSTNLTMAIGVESNEVEVGVYFPSGYTNPVDVFVSSGLIEWDWSFFTNIVSSNITESTWIDEAATNSPTHFWIAARSDLDSDGDGLSDSYEKYLYQTDPNLADTDGDGISDGAEIAAGTNPLYADSDGDGMGDAAELALVGSVATNGSGGVLVVVPGTGWYHALDPSMNLVYLGE